MSNTIPPLLSNSPPPSPLPEDDDDDEFGDFTGANDLSYGCENLSLPSSPDHFPKTALIPNGLDINRNTDSKITLSENPVLENEKDYQDKRKLSADLDALSLRIANFSAIRSADNFTSLENEVEEPCQNLTNSNCDHKNSEIYRDDPNKFSKISHNVEIEITDKTKSNDDEFRDFSSILDKVSGCCNSNEHSNQVKDVTRLVTNNNKETEIKLRLANDLESGSLKNEGDENVDDLEIKISAIEDEVKPELNFDKEENESQLEPKNGECQTENPQNKGLEPSSKQQQNPLKETNASDNTFSILREEEEIGPRDKNDATAISETCDNLGNLSIQSDTDTTSKQGSVRDFAPLYTTNIEHFENFPSVANTNKETTGEYGHSAYLYSCNENYIEEFGSTDVTSRDGDEEFGNFASACSINKDENSENLVLANTSKAGSSENKTEHYVTMASGSKLDDDEFGNFASECNKEIGENVDNFALTENKRNSFDENFAWPYNDTKDADADFGNFPSTSGTQKNENVFGDYTYADDDNVDFANFASPHETSKTGDDAFGTVASESTDDYANFHSFSFEEIPVKSAEEIQPKEKKSDGDDDFADFSSHEAFAKFDSPTLPVDPDEDDLDEFGEFISTTLDSEEPVAGCSRDPGTSHSSSFILMDAKQAYEKAEQVFKDAFPAPNIVLEDYVYESLHKDDFILNQLADITNTPALKYNWLNSATRKAFLKALNIDTRNILHGPSSNTSMPKFAANLGVQPLEPVKTENHNLTVLKSVSPAPIQPTPVDIPSSEFDWSGTDLTNPLDSFPKGLKEHHPVPYSDPKPPERQSQPPLEPLSPKVLTKTDLEQRTIPATDDFHDFASFQEPVAESWPNVVPLRETHISNDSSPSVTTTTSTTTSTNTTTTIATTTTTTTTKEVQLETKSWLQPTIIAPETMHKETHSKSPGPTVTQEDDEFDDFQMVLPGSDNTNIKIPVTNDILSVKSPSTDFDDKVVSEFDPFKVDLDAEKSLNISSSSNINISDSGSLTHVSNKLNIKEEKPLDINMLVPISDSIQTQKSQKQQQNEVFPVEPKEKVEEIEDEFTEFHFSAPTTLPPIMEPLKPVQMYPQATSTQINWPDPGISEDEIKKFEAVFANPPQPKNARKHDDNEWSDFVSVQKPSPVHKVRASHQERTSSPDLPLSVFNLGNIHPAKQPIPVITPQGLLQTKLSSNTSSNSPKSQIKNQMINPKHSYQQQPSIISNQFANQAYNFNSNSKPAVSQKSPDDDEWGEFVSSPLPPANTALSNGYHARQLGTSTPWTSFTPNIVINPAQFVRSDSAAAKRVPNVPVNKKSTVPKLGLPELGFIAPKVGLVRRRND